MDLKMNCEVCCEKNVGPEHYATERHAKNISLKEFAQNKLQFITNKKGIASVSCGVKTSFASITGCKQGVIKVSAKPNEEVYFKFKVRNESHCYDIHLLSIHLVHNQFNFTMSDHSMQVGCTPQTLRPMKTLTDEISVRFSSCNIGQYQTPILFHFEKYNKQSITLMREMVVYVELRQTMHENIISPYARKEVWAKNLHRSPAMEREHDIFKIPKNCKKFFANSLKLSEEADQWDKELAEDIRKTFSVGVQKDNYIKFFHNLLWYEEAIIRQNIKKYNMSAVTIKKQHNMNYGTCYALVVPGLGEKRPSLMIGDTLFIKLHNQYEDMFEAVVKDIAENTALIGDLHHMFKKVFIPDGLYDVRFFMSRVPLERMHAAVHDVKNERQVSRIFPTENKKMNSVQPIIDFFNPLVEGNLEQRCAVERIVSGTSGTAPYLLHGPPGTGKTVTIVEAILQLVLKKPKHRIMVCTDSNMAADHVATMLIKYSHMFATKTLLLRASSKYRSWETFPECLAKFSNGTCRQNVEVVPIEEFVTYSIVITTLSHAAMFARRCKYLGLPHHITHLFIDEAAQASEPACLIPVCGLLRETGTLVLAGDPQQLGPVVISHSAAKTGLGTSLMERLKKNNPLYSDIRNDPNYIVMLRNNFRSNPDILDIPDKMFYKGQLRALAKEDNISNIDILGEKPNSRAVVFHGVLSKEQKIGKSPSFFNMMECEMVLSYVKRLVLEHNVLMEDIGIVTPYARQVYQLNRSLKDLGYDKIEVGTVEAFQGKEKRIILISTVRANCNLLDHDAKFQLGFLVDDKRFNVAVTRAKAKVIVIGNPLCLQRDMKWSMFMQKCRELGTYHGFDSVSVDDETSREIVSNLIPMLQGIQIQFSTEAKNIPKLN